MGRVCPAPCESGCNRNEVEDFVGINSVEHFLGEYAIANKLALPKPAVSTGKKVAVIGGGPAGLSAAYQLALQGPRGHDLRRARRARRHDALRHPGLSHAARGARRRDPAHPRPGRDVAHELPHRHRRDDGADPRRLRRRLPGPGRAGRPRAAGGRRRCAELRHRHRLPEGLQRRAPAPCRQARGRRRRRRHLDRRGHRVAAPGPHREDQRKRPPRACDRRLRGARRGRGLGQAGRRGHADLDLRGRQDAGQPARGGTGAGRRHRHPRRPGAGVRGARRRRARDGAARAYAAKPRSSAAGSRSRTSKAPKRTSRPT